MNNKIIATNGVLNIVNIIYEFDDFIQLDDGTQHIIYYEESTPYFKINDTIALEVGKRIDSTGYELDQSNPYQKSDSDGNSESLIETKAKTYKIVGIIERPATNIEDYSAPGYTFITYTDEKEFVYVGQKSSFKLYGNLIPDFKQVDGISIMLGINDLMEDYSDSKISTYVSNYSNIRFCNFSQIFLE